MNPEFELRLINITFDKKKQMNQIASFTKASDPIKLEYDEISKAFMAETFAYSKLDDGTPVQLAVKCNNDSTIPKQIIPDEPTKDFIKVNAPNDISESYWIENSDDWRDYISSGKKYYYIKAPSHVSGGKLKILIDDQTCIVNIFIPGISFEEYNQILDDFKNGCWELILDNKSAITVEKEKEMKIGIYSDAFIYYIRKFSQTIHAIIKTPKKELHEKQVTEKIEKARPTTKTYMEIATKGMPRTVSSRGYQESYNTPENRYIVFLLERLLILLRKQKVVSNGIYKRIDQKIIELDKRINNMSDIGKIDPKKVKLEIARLSRIIENTENLKRELLDSHNKAFSPNPETMNFRFKITRDIRGEYNVTSFFAKVYEFNGERLNSRFDPLLRFSLDFYQNKFFRKFGEYFIETEKPDTINITNVEHARTIKYINKLDIINSPDLESLRNFMSNSEVLRKNDWKTNLTRQEKEQQKQEKNSIEKRKDYFKKQSANWQNSISNIDPLLNKLIKLYSNLTIDLKIKSNHYFPGSITFIQNPLYANAKYYYEKIMRECGIESDEFDSLLKIDDYGVLDLPKVYERWCLVKFIEIIIQQYNFIPKEDWKKKFLNAVSGSKLKGIQIDLESERLNLNLSISYERKLPNNKEPDYKIDLKKDGKDIAHLILDAKFKLYSDQNEISQEIEKIVGKYSEDGVNYVYVVHPTNKTIFTNSTTTQEWSDSSFYGGNSLVDNSKSPDHKKGAILMRPNSDDNFKRLLILFFQYAAEEFKGVRHTDVKYDPKPSTVNLFCPVCASSVKEKPIRIGERGRKYSISCENPDCGFEYIITYCNICFNRLWKLGRYWTYHNTSPLSPYDIQCPVCGASNSTNIDIKMAI